jgi:hypothetical protein
LPGLTIAKAIYSFNIAEVTKYIKKEVFADLKLKFKSEEKCNQALIDKTMSYQIAFNLSHFE